MTHHRYYQAAGWLLLGPGLLAACHPAEQAPPLPNAPLLEAVPAGYRPVARQDTLDSYWAPNEAYEDSLFQLTDEHLSQVLVRVQLIPASVAIRTGLDTLRFKELYSELFSDKKGFSWEFVHDRHTADSVVEDAREIPLKLFSTATHRLILLENRRWRTTHVVYNRNAYLMDYPFHPVAVAKINDSILYARTFLYRAYVPGPDTLHTYFLSGEHQKRVAYAADQLDTTRMALLRFTFRQLRRSPNLPEDSNE